MISFLIVHGWQNRRPSEHWQHWLARQLRARGHEVAYPQLPNPFFPEPAEWVRTLRHILAGMNSTRRVVICHSLGCMAWLHLAATDQRPPVVDQLLFVAPPGPKFLAGQAELARFAPPVRWKPLLRATCRTRPRLVCSDNDPYCEEGAYDSYPGTFDTDLIPAEGHLDIPAGYGRWPSLLDWCADPTTRIVAKPTPVGISPSGLST